MEEYHSLLVKLDSESDYKKRALLANDLACHLWKSGKNDLAKSYIIKELDNLTLINDKIIDSRLYSTLGIISSLDLDFHEANLNFEKALNFALQADHQQSVINCYVNIGNMKLSLHNYEEALDYFYKALKYSHDCEFEDLTTLLKIYNNISVVLIEIRNYHDALYYLKISLKKHLLLKDQTQLANIMTNMAHAYYKLGDCSLASAYLKRAIKIFKEHNHYLLFSCYLDMIKVCKAKNDLVSALKYSNLAIELSENDHNQPLMFKSYSNQLSLQLELKNTPLIKLYIEKCNSIIDNISDKKMLLQYYTDCYIYFESINDFKTSFSLLKKAMSLKDELNDSVFNTKIAEYKIKIDYEHKKNELDLYKKKTIELENYNHQIEQQKDELIYLNKSKDSILNIVSHDLKNSIGAIIPIIELIQHGKKDNSLDPFYNMIERTAQKSLALVNDILDNNRIDMHDFKLQLEKENINAHIKKLEKSIISQASLKNISVSINYDPSDLWVMANQLKLNQIILNLCTNAIKFSYENNKIIIATNSVKVKRKNYAMIAFTDFGVGIPKEFIPLVFDKFSKASRKGTKGENTTGLGLSIVKRLVELHGGFINVSSELNKGSVFSVYIPICKK